MAQAVLSEIFIYPIKSAGGISLPSSMVESTGLTFDRRFMICDTKGKMVTGRTSPEIPQISLSLLPDGVQLSHSSMSPLTLKYASFSMKPFQTHVWDDEFEAFTTSAMADGWLSHLLGKQVKLLYTGEESPRFGSKADMTVSFADAFPLLLISEASLEALNDRSPRHNVMSQFRTNLVVKNTLPFAEDSWAKIRIGDVMFAVSCPCSRCVFTTLDVKSGTYHAEGEPITTLSQFRTDDEGNVNFGVNIVALNDGQIHADDEIEILEYRTPEVYKDTSTPKMHLQCVEKQPVANDFMTFWFEQTNGVLPTYRAGQHLPIELMINGEHVKRRYTLSSSPTRPERLSISVKRVEGGLVSNWLHDHFEVGSQLKALQPAGDFFLSDEENERSSLLLLSAGSGVTPMMSILRTLADLNTVEDIVFYHQCRSEQDIPFHDELKQFAEQHPELNIIICLTAPSAGWQGPSGRLNQDHFSLIPELLKRQVFVCGPQGFMDSAIEQLREAGVPDDQLYQEFFTPPDVKTDDELLTVNINVNGEYIRGNNQAFILKQAEEAGVYLPNNCRAGVCGTCKVKLISGDVEQPNLPGLMPGEREDGFILTCCCVPKSDIEIATL
ncbi:hybrid-cluster NAD(P)-dependent oxidoreductase [Veronia pacifica]|uniref:Flavodoxin n=1 Tax=Veronia pacifica TaxID=1080227 RepID=A0A1C3EG40_9GAMM|nr:hybrid-cluster NAD(P)-dependent oxidoreductase [Veronia pacifica]ODA32226.1 flavodoxin [Veronia pacifica]